MESRFLFAHLCIPGDSSLILHDRELSCPQAGARYLFHLERREIRVFDWAEISPYLRKLEKPEPDLISYALLHYAHARRRFERAGRAQQAQGRPSEGAIPVPGVTRQAAIPALTGR
jgi:hypothetical protein